MYCVTDRQRLQLAVSSFVILLVLIMCHVDQVRKIMKIRNLYLRYSVSVTQYMGIYWIFLEKLAHKIGVSKVVKVEHYDAKTQNFVLLLSE